MSTSLVLLDVVVNLAIIIVCIKVRFDYFTLDNKRCISISFINRRTCNLGKRRFTNRLRILLYPLPTTQFTLKFINVLVSLPRLSNGV